VTCTILQCSKHFFHRLAKYRSVADRNPKQSHNSMMKDLIAKGGWAGEIKRQLEQLDKELDQQLHNQLKQGESDEGIIKRILIDTITDSKTFNDISAF
jgi:hypothetical protein